jgi:hypothetical protein
MLREAEHEILECEIAQLRENQREILYALKDLFDLLEEYAPMWYTEEHHRQAVSALACSVQQCL